jgi:hypothetical protein
MRKLIAMVLIGAGAAFVSAYSPAQAMTASGAVASKVAEQANSGVEEVRHRRHWRHRHWGRHRGWRHRHWRHRYYSPYYYSPYYYGYGYRYRPRFGIYLRF